MEMYLEMNNKLDHLRDLRKAVVGHMGHGTMVNFTNELLKIFFSWNELGNFRKNFLFKTIKNEKKIFFRIGKA